MSSSFFFSSRRRHTRLQGDWSSDVCSSDLAQALSPAGARGLAQLLPGTAALTARGVDVRVYPEWITVPHLNLHLGAAHFQELLQRLGGRGGAGPAAHKAGTAPLKRLLQRARA